MSSAPVVQDAVAIVPVRDVGETIKFYSDVLGFETRMVSEDRTFAAIARGGAALHFIQTDDEKALAATAANISVYIWVRGLDALYAELGAELDRLPEGRVRPPFDQPYGVREFHVKDPDGCLLFFAESG